MTNLNYSRVKLTADVGNKNSAGKRESHYSEQDKLGEIS